MNKKLFLGMFAAASMLFATSCSNDELDVVQSGNEAQVSFSLGLEGGIATRAISDGKSADVLMYAVFDKEGNRINTIQKVSRTGVTFPTTENITLAKGQTYKVAFWAQDEDCKAYTVSDDMKVTVDYTTNNISNNDETRDAFFKTVEFTVTGSTSIDVEMKRPFAQINVGVTSEDWEAAVASGITVAQSSVVIKNAATELNLLYGTVSGETEVSYELANIPSDPAILQVDTDGNGIKEDYNWLSMSYILPADNTTGYAKTTLDNVAFVFASDGEPIEFNQGLNSVPVQRNWRTNIIGKILTGDITFNIVIDPVYDNDHNVEVPYATIDGVAYKSFADAMAAVETGKTIKLEGETTLEGVANSKLFTVNKNITIDLNGYGFVAKMPDVTANSSIFEVVNGGELTIIGDGNVKFVTKAAPNHLVAFINNIGGTVNLKGGNWTISETGDYALIPTFVDNNSNTSNVTLNIDGGTYTFHRALFRNFVNNNTTVATMNISGGTFNGRESKAGVIWNQKPNANIQKGAGVINVTGGTFNNVEIKDDFSGVVYVNNQEELNNALANVNTHTVMLGAGKYVPSLYNGDIPTRKSLTIIGSEGTQFAYTGSNFAGQLALAGFDNFTIRNCEILRRENVKNWGMVVFGSSNNPNGVYTIENCTFNGVGTQGIYINEQASGTTYNILNCTFDGDFGTEGAITIQTNKDVNHIVNVKGCTFNNIPNTSHRIFLAKVSTGFYYGWTLNTESKAYSAYDLAILVAMGYTKIDLADGEYDVYGCGGKTLTLNGSTNAVLKLYNDGEDGCDYAFGSAGTGVGDVTFNGLTIDTQGNTGNYKGFAYMKGTFNNCNFVGAYSLNNANDFAFNKCTFDFKNGYFWTWGAKSATFDGCTFNGNSKAILAHGWESTAITIKDCKFAATEKGYTGSGDNTACVEIDPAGTNTYTINFTGTNTKTDNYSGWTRIKDGSTGHTISGI
ncbi:DUF6562 domain-containing protein [Parabacteroides distasonis]|uniref:DUF6562 domain-containing protein n=1 Tax=Parabacteroides distasonis TaxID=823 RepID=UPI0035159327